MRAGTSETELAPPRRATGHRPGSRLELERRQTRSSNLGFRARARCFCAGKEDLISLRAAEEREGFWGKEFRFAYI